MKRRYRLVPLDEAVEIVETGRQPRGAAVLLTFDDGYVDNYEIAFPVLSSQGLQGVFFLPTAFIGTDHIPWWDTIAFIVKNSRRRVFRVASREYDLDNDGEILALTRALGCAPLPSPLRIPGRIALLVSVSPADRPAGNGFWAPPRLAP